VPWAGPRLRADGGIYYVGMATAGDYRGEDDPPTFDAQFRLADLFARLIPATTT
jgi:hypothetical protein